MKGDFIERPSLPQLKETLEHGSCPKLTGLWRDLVNARELKAGQADGNFAC